MFIEPRDSTNNGSKLFFELREMLKPSTNTIKEIFFRHRFYTKNYETASASTLLLFPI